MPSFVYNSFLRDLATGAIDLDTDTFRILLTTSAYTENQDTHTKRSDITNEVVGTGYTTKGAVTTVTVAAVDTTNNRVVTTFGAVSWASSTITARKAVIYKDRGGVATADELVAVIDFGTDQISNNGTFSLSASTITAQN
jgi:hypothetical protein